MENLPPVGTALLLDVGAVLLNNEFEMLREYCGLKGIAGVPLGPLEADPANDPDWQQYLAGEIPAYSGGYLERVAHRLGFSDFRALFREFSQTPEIEQFNAETVALAEEVKAAGLKLGILTNEMYAISGREWVEQHPHFRLYDCIIDSTDVGVKKPAPDGYLAAAAALDTSIGEIVFLDDTVVCVEGARAVGMWGVHVDPVDRSASLTEARLLLGLPTGRPDLERAFRLVRVAERDYHANDLAAIMRCFHPDVSIYWNGVKVANGLDEARRFHIDRLGFGRADGPQRFDYRLRKTLRAASGDDVSVEWESSYRTPDGKQVVSRAAEVWKLRGDLLIEWHAYNHRVES